MTFQPIEGQDGYYRDTRSGAIVNKKSNDFSMYVNNRKRLTGDKQRITDLETEITNIKDDLGDIKMMLQHFMDKHK